MLGTLGQHFRNIVDGAGIECDVLTRASVAARRTSHQLPVFVHEVEGNAVDLDLAQVMQIGAGLGLHAFGPRSQFVLIEYVVQTQHPLEMIDRSELGGEPAADELRGRIRGAELGMRLLEIVQFTEQCIELAVRDNR